eukprot:15366140-Ditylum_brightwellii.AAC.4
MRATINGTLTLHPTLAHEAITAHVLPNITNSLLMLIGHLCNNGCMALLHKDFLHIYKNNKVVLAGICNRLDGLWDIPINATKWNTTQTTIKLLQSLSLIVRKDKTKSEFAVYFHACAFSPPLSTFQAAVKKGNFIKWPETAAMEKGHLDQERKNLQSTK